jgi:fatty-acyl-CoA synthase
MEEEIHHQLKDAGATMLVFQGNKAGVLENLKKDLPVLEGHYLFLQQPGEENYSCPEWAIDFYDATIDQPINEPISEEAIDLDDPLAIIYTSGVTGKAKGALLTHSQTYFKCFQQIFYTDMRSDDIYLSQLPLFHSGGLFIVATPCLCRGATMVIRKRFHPEQFAEDIQNYRATIIFALTTMWRFVLETGKLNEVDTQSVRVVFGGGERTPQNIFDELAQRGLFMQQVFGQTENSLMTVMPQKDVQRKIGSIGLPGFFTDVWIADSQGNELPHGRIGEIVAKGPNVMLGYWNQPEKTKETIRNGILFTGDLGYRDEEGYFYMVDRAKDMYRSGGENVYPAEIEKVLSNHPKILQVAIIGVPDDRWGETGMAFVVPAEGHTLTYEEMITFLKGKIASYKFPKYLKIMDKIPMTESGKMKKVLLKNMVSSGSRGFECLKAEAG